MTTKISFPPSSAKLWSLCSAHRSLVKKFKTDQFRSNSARKGVFIHDAAQKILTGEVVNVDDQLDEKDKSVLNFYVTYLRDNKFPIEQIESSLELDEYTKGKVDAYKIENDILTVVDLKTGLTPISAVNNLQLILYAAMIVKIKAVNINIIRLVIVQPQDFNSEFVKVHELSLTELKIKFNNLLDRRVLAFSKDAKFTVGEHCLHCSASHVCTALHNKSLSYLSSSKRLTDIADTTNVDISLQLLHVQRAIKFLKMLETGLEKEVEHKLKTGKRFLFHELKTLLTNRFWKDEDLTKTTLKAFNVDPYNKPKLISPNFAQQKGIDKDIVNALSTRSLSKLKVGEIDNMEIKDAIKPKI